MARSAFLVIVCLAVSASASPTRTKRSIVDWLAPPDTAQMIVSNGYPVEKHEIVTEDGYILGVFRIPYGRGQEPQSGKPPVILQHGIMCSSDCWVLSIPEKGLAYVLADHGYDVWIGNNRGISYSQKHVNLTIDDGKFWDYSFHEMGMYDVPAMIDYIRNKTGEDKVTYIGHSQGTSQFLAMASMRPEYNEKVRVASLLAPVAYLDGTEGLVRILSHFSKALAFTARIFGIHHVLEHNFLISTADHIACRPNSWLSFFCDQLLNVIAGFDSPQLNKTLVEVVAQYSPSGASIKQLNHFGQLTSNGDKFTLYDYGSSENQVKYHQPTPKEYNLAAITAPVMLHFAANDYIARPKNVQKIASLIPTNKMIQVEDSGFNHIDFMWAIDVVPLLYRDVLDNIKQYL